MRQMKHYFGFFNPHELLDKKYFWFPVLDKFRTLDWVEIKEEIANLEATFEVFRCGSRTPLELFSESCAGIGFFEAVCCKILTMNTKVILVIIAILVVGIGVGAYITYDGGYRKPTVEKTGTGPFSVPGNLLGYVTSNGSLWVIDLKSDKSSVKVIDPDAPEIGNAFSVSEPRSWSFSPDGTNIAFDWYDDQKGNKGIAVISVSEPSQLKFLYPGSTPKWSPTEDVVLFEDRKDNSIKIISLSNNQITTFEGVNIIGTQYPWFSDGRRFIASNGKHTDPKIALGLGWHVINAKTEEKELLRMLDLKWWQLTLPVTSPTDNEIALVVQYKNLSIALFNIDSKDFEILASVPSERLPGTGYKSLNWSPDGKNISYVDISLDVALMVVDKDKSEEKIIVEGKVWWGWPNELRNPCWLSSGKDIVFFSLSEGEKDNLYVINVESGERQIIASGVKNFSCHR